MIIELTFLNELILIRQVNQTSATFATLDIFYKKDLSFNQTSAMVVMIY